LFATFLPQPTPSPSPGPALLIDILLRTAAVVAFLCFAMFLVGHDPAASWAAIVVALLCAVLGTSVLFSGIWSPFVDWVVMAAAAAVTAASTFVLYERRRVWSAHRDTWKGVAVAVLTAAAVPAFNFWTETSYLPSQNTASLELSVEALVQRDPGGADHWVVTSTIRNLSDVRAFVIISGLTTCDWADEEKWTDEPTDAEPEGNCVRLDAPFNEGSWLDSEATLTHRTPVEVDAARPLLEVRLRVAYARADRVIQVLDTDRDATEDEVGDCEAGTVWDLQPPSRLVALARHELQLMYADRTTGSTYYFGAAGSLVCRDPEPYEGFNQARFQRLNQHLSLTEATTVWAGWRSGEPATEPSG